MPLKYPNFYSHRHSLSTRPLLSASPRSSISSDIVPPNSPTCFNTSNPIRNTYCPDLLFKKDSELQSSKMSTETIQTSFQMDVRPPSEFESRRNSLSYDNNRIFERMRFSMDVRMDFQESNRSKRRGVVISLGIDQLRSTIITPAALTCDWDIRSYGLFQRRGMNNKERSNTFR